MNFFKRLFAPLPGIDVISQNVKPGYGEKMGLLATTPGEQSHLFCAYCHTFNLPLAANCSYCGAKYFYLSDKPKGPAPVSKKDTEGPLETIY